MTNGTILTFKDIDTAHRHVLVNKNYDLFRGGRIGSKMSMNGAEKMLAMAGFKILSVEKKMMSGYPHYTIICSK